MIVEDRTYPNPKYEPRYEGEGTLDLRDALNLVLLFHSPSPWDAAKVTEWLRITGTREASTKVLCDHMRAVLAEVFHDIPPTGDLI